LSEGQTTGRQLRANARPLRLVVGGARGVSPTEAGVPAARGQRSGCTEAGAVCHGKDGKFACNVPGRVGRRVLAAHADEPLAVADDRRAEELGPRRGSNGEKGDQDGARAFHEGVEEGMQGKSEALKKVSH
jgi:hypothetical protein